jgi:hypothetical protein
MISFQSPIRTDEKGSSSDGLVGMIVLTLLNSFFHYESRHSSSRNDLENPGRALADGAIHLAMSVLEEESAGG